VVDHDVVRLDVAVHYAHAMTVVQSLHHNANTMHQTSTSSWLPKLESGLIVVVVVIAHQLLFFLPSIVKVEEVMLSMLEAIREEWGEGYGIICSCCARQTVVGYRRRWQANQLAVGSTMKR